MYFDTHCHFYDLEKLNEKSIDKIHKEAVLSGVVGVLNISTSVKDYVRVVEQSKKFKNMWAAIGFHPHIISKTKDQDYKALINLLENDKLGKIKAIGEIGLDFYKNNLSLKEKQIQKKRFIEQLEICKKFNKTANIHSRNAAAETYDILSNYPKLKKIIHCFTYGPKEAKMFLELDCWISFSGIITFKKNVDSIIEALKIVPDDKVLVETDAPLLSPEPYRGKTNYPKHIKYTYDKISQIKGKNMNKQIYQNVIKALSL